MFVLILFVTAFYTEVLQLSQTYYIERIIRDSIDSHRVGVINETGDDVSCTADAINSPPGNQQTLLLSTGSLYATERELCHTV